MRTKPEPLPPLAWQLHYSNRADPHALTDAEEDWFSRGDTVESICLDEVEAVDDGALDTNALGACQVVSAPRAPWLDNLPLTSSHA